MRAIVHTRYARTDNLELRELPIPSPKPGEVLVRVHATSMHADIWHLVNGRPYFLRLMGAGLFGPGGKIPGTDLSGVVEAVGSSVTRFKQGDAIFGETTRSHQWSHGGAFADYAVAPAHKLALKPATLSFVEAAALPTSGLIACQATFDEGAVKAGDAVLVNGAAGAVGLFALQLCKDAGAVVTAVDGSAKLEALRQAGADAVLDYTVMDYTAGEDRYDLVIDIPGNHPIKRCLGVLKPWGRYVYIGHDGYGATGGRWIGSMARFLRLWLVQWLRGQRPRFPPAPDYPKRLAMLGRLAADGRLRPRVGRVLALDHVPEALRCLEQGAVEGKIVVEVAPPAQ
ncbi:MAG: NAD(P)-dependent alcohol dehydrogenase [Deltaproteobacteria bacterium]|nr:NAD(P)-dependent alcohol dehydrogenase [Deltaproteobacteria bacterium]